MTSIFNQNAVAILKPYDFFGEAGIITESPRSATAITEEESELLCISKAAFDSIIASYPFIAKSILFKIVSYHYSNYQLDHKKETLSIEEMLPEYDHETVLQLFFERIGLSKSSNMTVVGLNQALKKSHSYILSEKGFIEGKSHENNPIQLDEFSYCNSPPKHIEVEGYWNPTETIKGDGNNILGGNGTFTMKEKSIKIPVVNSTSEALAYYKSKLISFGEEFSFSSDTFPIWDMIIGERYMDDFIMTPQGGGMYIEYHKDKPHFHMPANKNSHGYYILGKKVTNYPRENKYHLTAFTIPFGLAVYTSNGVIHCDAGLKGSWIVGYANAKDFSTVLLKDPNNAMVQVEFACT